MLVQSFLMEMVKHIKPEKHLDKDPAKLSHIMPTMTCEALISAPCMLGYDHIFTTWGYWVYGKFLINHL